MEKYELGVAVQKVYDFIWDEYCDWYIEMVKPRLYKKENETDADRESRAAALAVLKAVLVDSLKLLHPFMPFITEEIFCNLQDAEESIMISSWPVYSEDRNFASDESDIETIKEAVRGVRNVRTEMNVPPSRKAQIFVVTVNDDVKKSFAENDYFLKTLAYASDVTVQADKTGIAEDAVSVLLAHAAIYIPFSDLVDLEKELERLKKEEKRLEGELKRSNGMLNNERFLSKAPAEKIEEEKAKLAKYEKLMEQVKERIANLNK